MDVADAFDELQAHLGAALTLNEPGSDVDHVVVALPSFSVGESLLSHYADRIPSLEHRYALGLFALDRIDSCELVFVSCQAVDEVVIEYYLSLLPEARRATVRRRFRVFEVPDPSPRAVAAKLLDRPDLLADLKRSFADRPAFIEPWNVTHDEVQVALDLGVPINGTSPGLWHIGFKSAGRRLFREVGVPVPLGVEDVQSVDDVLASIATIRSERPTACAVVVKLDDSGAGDGNVVLDLRGAQSLRDAVESLPDWYLDDLASGGVVEELIVGTRFTSPSAQIDIRPDGTVDVLSTHEQELGGSGGQVYMGCRFPAEPAYSARLAEYAQSVGSALARLGAMGRASIDFAAAQDATGAWNLYALEINLRKGGTTHPYSTLRNLAPGSFDCAASRWLVRDGTERAYRATDNLVDPAWVGLPESVPIEAVVEAGLQFDARRGTGVVLHMLSGLAIDGRIGMTAIGTDPASAADLYDRSAAAIASAAASRRRA